MFVVEVTTSKIQIFCYELTIFNWAVLALQYCLHCKQQTLSMVSNCKHLFWEFHRFLVEIKSNQTTWSQHGNIWNNKTILWGQKSNLVSVVGPVCLLLEEEEIGSVTTVKECACWLLSHMFHIHSESKECLWFFPDKLVTAVSEWCVWWRSREQSAFIYFGHSLGRGTLQKDADCHQTPGPAVKHSLVSCSKTWHVTPGH